MQAAAIPKPPKVRESYFASCERIPAGQENAGACLPGNGQTQSASPKPGVCDDLRGLHQRIAQPDGGFTYRIFDQSQPQEGFALSPYPDRSEAKTVAELRPVDIIKYIRKNRDLLGRKDHYLGAWHDPESGKAFLDVSVVLQEEAAAKDLALAKDQIAYFDLKNKTSVTVNRHATSGGAATKDLPYGSGPETIAAFAAGRRSQSGTDSGLFQGSDRARTDAGGTGGSPEGIGETVLGATGSKAITSEAPAPPAVRPTPFDESKHPRGQPENAGQFVEAGAGKEKAGTVAQKVAAQTAKVQFADQPIANPENTAIDASDLDEIERAMTPYEQRRMEEQLSIMRDENMSDAAIDMDFDIDEEAIASDAGYGLSSICEHIGDLIDEHVEDEGENQRLHNELSDLESAFSRGSDYGPQAIHALRKRLTNLPEAILVALDQYEDNASIAIQLGVEEEEERQRNNYAEQLAMDYDDSSDREAYLHDFYNSHQDRFQESDLDEHTWGQTEDGDWWYQFSTSAGSKYLINIFDKTMAGEKIQEVQFKDNSGSFSITGAGNAHEVFSAVVPAIVAYVQHKNPGGLVFSASEASRRRLYDRLVKSVSRIAPDYSGLAVEMGPGVRWYVLVKRDGRDAMVEKIKEQARSRGLNPDEALKIDVLVKRLASNLNSRWWEAKSWDRSLRTSQLAMGSTGTKTLGPHKFGCLMAPLPPAVAQEVKAWALANIPDEHLAPEGREPHIHLTIKYGLKNSNLETVAALKAMLANVQRGPINLRLQGLSLFTGGKDGSVLKADVISPDCHRLNALITELFPCEDKYPEYLPHVTISYLKPEAAAIYTTAPFPLAGQPIQVDTLEWSGADGTRELIPLTVLPQIKSQPNNDTANYFKEVGGFRGAIREDGKWVGIRDWRVAGEHIPVPPRRWQGAPNRDIILALISPVKSLLSTSDGRDRLRDLRSKYRQKVEVEESEQNLSLQDLSLELQDSTIDWQPQHPRRAMFAKSMPQPPAVPGSPFDESKHPRGQPDNAGQFVEAPESTPEADGATGSQEADGERGEVDDLATEYLEKFNESDQVDEVGIIRANVALQMGHSEYRLTPAENDSWELQHIEDIENDYGDDWIVAKDPLDGEWMISDSDSFQWRENAAGDRESKAAIQKLNQEKLVSGRVDTELQPEYRHITPEELEAVNQRLLEEGSEYQIRWDNTHLEWVAEADTAAYQNYQTEREYVDSWDGADQAGETLEDVAAVNEELEDAESDFRIVPNNTQATWEAQHLEDLDAEYGEGWSLTEEDGKVVVQPGTPPQPQAKALNKCMEGPNRGKPGPCPGFKQERLSKRRNAIQEATHLTNVQPRREAPPTRASVETPSVQDSPATADTPAPAESGQSDPVQAERLAEIDADLSSFGSDESKQLRSVLSKSPLKGAKLLGEVKHKNEALLFTLEDGSQGVFKPASGEFTVDKHGRPMRYGVPSGTYYRREVASSLVADVLGFSDLVPTTTFRHDGTEEGSIQAFVDNAKSAFRVSSQDRFDGKLDAARAAIFDYVVGHNDRHQGNWLLKENPGADLPKIEDFTSEEEYEQALSDARHQTESEPYKLTLIDNGLAFPLAYHERDWFNLQFWKHATDHELEMPDLSDWKDKWPEIERALKTAGLEDEAIKLTQGRFDAVTQFDGKYIADLPNFTDSNGSPLSFLAYMDDYETDRPL